MLIDKLTISLLGIFITNTRAPGGDESGLDDSKSVELRANMMLGMGAVELKRGNGWQAEEHYQETLVCLIDTGSSLA